MGHLAAANLGGDFGDDDVEYQVGGANAAERQASATGIGLSSGGSAADVFGSSPPHRSPFS